MLLDTLTIIYLTAESLIDIRERRISLRMTAVYAGIVLVMLLAGVNSAKRGLSFMAGILIAACSLLTGGAIGMGDAITAAAVGLSMEPARMLKLLVYAFLSCAAVSLVLLLSGKKTGKDSVPFVPFLLAGSLIAFAVG
ncbi:MAG: prepilin peptidase [Blautia sp.]|nr:prepilin peptidase [Blautia sp.]